MLGTINFITKKSFNKHYQILKEYSIFLVEKFKMSNIDNVVEKKIS